MGLWIGGFFWRVGIKVLDGEGSEGGSEEGYLRADWIRRGGGREVLWGWGMLDWVAFLRGVMGGGVGIV